MASLISFSLPVISINQRSDIKDPNIALDQNRPTRNPSKSLNSLELATKSLHGHTFFKELSQTHPNSKVFYVELPSPVLKVIKYCSRTTGS